MKFYILNIFFLIGFFSKAQSPFATVRKTMEAEDFKTSQNILDSCSFNKFQLDSVLYYKGLLTLKKGNLKGAKAICASLKSTYPSFTEVHYLAALIYFVSEDFGQSIEEFSVILKHDSTHIKALYNRSLAFGMLDDYPSAIEGLSKCIAINPGYSIAYYSRAYWHEFKGNYAEAKKDYEKSIQLDPNYYDAYFGLAYIYQNQKENDKACETIQKAISAGSQIAQELKEIFCRQ